MFHQAPLPRVGLIRTVVVAVILITLFAVDFSPSPGINRKVGAAVPLTAAPENDDFRNAQPILPASGVVFGTTVGATKESSEQPIDKVTGTGSVWYRWQAPSDGRFVFTTSGSNFNTLLAVYTGNSISGTQVAANDNDDRLCPIGSFLPTLSRVSFDAVGGVVYHIAVDTNGGGGGNVTLRWGRSARINVRTTTVSNTPPSGARGAILGGDICSGNQFTGFFSFSDLPTGGRYTITIAKEPGTDFGPAAENPSISPLTGDVTLVYYLRQPAFSIFGRVTNLPSNDMTGLIVSCVSLNGGLVSIPVANTAIIGTFVTFTCPGLPANAQYLVTPSKLGYKFEPANKTIQLFGDTDSGAYTVTAASYTISGRVTLTNSLTGLSGVTVALGGSQTASQVTDTTGNYSFTVPHGGNYSVTPSHPNFTLTPSSQSFTNVSEPKTSNFAANFLLQLILDETGQLAAVDSILQTREPFFVINTANLLNQGVDRNTRVAIFVSNFQLGPGESSSSVVINLVGSNSQTYDIPAEDVRRTSNPTFTQITFRLPDTLSPGTCTLFVKARGLTSNIGAMTIRAN